ncbi:MAG: ribokinase [Acidimicrobiales bacterium]|nr:ribokinase [Acidimicrobiales bacterium]
MNERRSGRPKETMTHETQPTLAVVGSTMIDLVAYAEVLPEDGETLLGEKFQMGFGGKGANQAVMAKLMGAEVAMVNCLGDDDYAQMYRKNFADYGINTDHVYTAPGASGVAPIWVDGQGHNRIIIIPGANHALTAQQATAAIEALAPLQVVIGQFEIPQEVTAAGFAAAQKFEATTVLNPAPASALCPALLAVTDWLIPNEHEFALLAGSEPSDTALLSFATQTATRLLVTLGEAGVALAVDGEVIRLPTTRVEAIDTTGAGDAFVGAFAYGLAAGLAPVAAAQLGMDRATDSVTKLGTQSSYAPLSPR